MQHAQKIARIGAVEVSDFRNSWLWRQFAAEQHGRFAGTHRGRDQGDVGRQSVARHIASDLRGVRATARIELAVAVEPGRTLFFCLGVAQKHQAEHGGDFIR